MAWVGRNVGYITEDASIEKQAKAFEPERQKALRAREKALEEHGPCQWCNEPADFAPGWCGTCVTQDRKLRYDTIPHRYVEDLNESYR